MSFWQDKSVVVTGGSKGLGREIAMKFARCGARVTIAARTQSELLAACESGNHAGVQLDWIAMDVCSDDSVQSGIDQVAQRHGKIDVWVNNVGRSTRTEFRSCRVEDYREFMEVNFYSAVRCTLAVLDYLESTSGHLVNIGSLSSKTAWPYVAPYTTSKHALDGFHHQLRLEGPSSIHYLLVCPGPIARSDAGHRYQRQAEDLGEAATRPGAGVKLDGISPARLADQIEVYCRRRKPELIMPAKTRILFALSRLSPALGDRLLKRFFG